MARSARSLRMGVVALALVLLIAYLGISFN
jgi:hypothetical protein